MKTFSFSLFFLLVSIFGFSQNFRYFLDKGDEYYMNDEYENAVLFFTKAINADSKNDTGFWYRGDAYFKLEKYVEAASDYGKAAFIRPNYWKYYKKRGDCYFKMLNYQVAEIAYTESIKLDNTVSETWYYRGICYSNMQNQLLSCSDFEKAYQLGNKDALKDALLSECSWAKSLSDSIICPPVSSWVENQVDPFTGASFVSKGISISDFEIKSIAENAYIVDNVIGIDDEFLVKIMNPRGFCSDINNDIYFGTAYILYDSTGVEISSIPDIYENSKTGYPADYIKYLSMKASFSNLIIGGRYTLKIRFYDKRSTAEQIVIFPFYFNKKTSISNQTNSSINTLGIGINSKSVDITIDSMKCNVVNQDGNIDIYNIVQNTMYTLNLMGSSGIPKNSESQVLFINKYGEYFKSEESKLLIGDSNAQLTFSTQNINPGNYSVLIKIRDNQGKNFSFVIPTNLK